MLQSGKKTVRRATLILAIIFLIFSFVYLAHEFQQTQSKIFRGFEKQEPTKFFKLLIQKEKKEDSVKPHEDPEKKPPDPLIVQSIKLLPQNPTITDSIKAEATANYDNHKVSYEYKWYVNNTAIEDVKNNILSKERFKKNDQITVVVTPFMEGKQGHSFISVPVLIENSPPSLDYKEIPLNTKLTDAIELQLSANDPDGDILTYALEPPILDGMMINSKTGLIIWKPQKKEKGIYKFTASAADSDGGKAVRTFELQVK